MASPSWKAAFPWVVTRTSHCPTSGVHLMRAVPSATAPVERCDTVTRRSTGLTLGALDGTRHHDAAAVVGQSGGGVDCVESDPRVGESADQSSGKDREDGGRHETMHRGSGWLREHEACPLLGGDPLHRAVNWGSVPGGTPCISLVAGKGLLRIAGHAQRA